MMSPKRLGQAGDAREAPYLPDGNEKGGQDRPQVFSSCFVLSLLNAAPRMHQGVGRRRSTSEKVFEINGLQG